MPFELFDGEQAENLEHAVKMHSDLSRVTTRVFVREACGAWGDVWLVGMAFGLNVQLVALPVVVNWHSTLPFVSC